MRRTAAKGVDESALFKSFATRPPRFLRGITTPALTPLAAKLRAHIHEHTTHFTIAKPGQPGAVTLYARKVDEHDQLSSPIRAGSLKADRALFTFDAYLDGYDGQSSGVTKPEPCRLKQFNCPRCDGRLFHLRAILEYSGLDELSAEEVRHAEDYFSWFWLVARCAGCEWENFVADIECA